VSAPQFGRARPAGRLLAARSLVYLQAGVLGLGAGWMFVALVMAGSPGSTTFSMQGLVDQASVSGGAVVVLALLNLAMAAAAVFLEREAERNPEGYRAAFTALEIGSAFYLVGFIGTAVGDLLFGPVLALIVVGIHWWPELDARLLGGGGAGAPTPLASSSTGLEAGGPAAAALSPAALPEGPGLLAPPSEAPSAAALPPPSAVPLPAVAASFPPSNGDLPALP
jgi:hypothetical protein